MQSLQEHGLYMLELYDKYTLTAIMFTVGAFAIVLCITALIGRIIAGYNTMLAIVLSMATILICAVHVIPPSVHNITQKIYPDINKTAIAKFEADINDNMNNLPINKKEVTSFKLKDKQIILTIKDTINAKKTLYININNVNPTIDINTLNPKKPLTVTYQYLDTDIEGLVYNNTSTKKIKPYTWKKGYYNVIMKNT